MRLIRPHSGNKQNRCVMQTSTQRGNTDQWKKQLKVAHSQINMLKTTNQQLSRQVEESQKELINVKGIRQELEFYREQDQNMRQQLSNYEEINKKLRQQLRNVQIENQMLKGRGRKDSTVSQMQIKNTPRQSLVNQQKSFTTTRSSYNQTRLNSTMSERSKGNHSSTPKAKVQINWNQIMPDQLPERRRVFL